MQKVEKILSEMDELLDAIIDNALELLNMSRRVIAEEELEPLQQHQQELVNSLLEKDETFQKICPPPIEEYQSPLRNTINEKLDKFKKINTEFIDNIMNMQGLIQFEKGKIKKKK